MKTKFLSLVNRSVSTELLSKAPAVLLFCFTFFRASPALAIVGGICEVRCEFDGSYSNNEFNLREVRAFDHTNGGTLLSSAYWPICLQHFSYSVRQSLASAQCAASGLCVIGGAPQNYFIIAINPLPQFGNPHCLP